MAKQLPFHAIVVVGPESSGKTTLAYALSTHLAYPVVEEYARYYLSILGRPYTEADLPNIARGQHRIEDVCRVMTNLPTVSDTDAFTIKVWQEYKFKHPCAEVDALLPSVAGRLYLLCAPDLPWQPDPLRENPNDRDAIFDYHIKVLSNAGANFAVVQGIGPDRLACALRMIEEKTSVASCQL